MIFRTISYQIALQFTGFVFIILLMNGMFFITADVHNAKRQGHDRIQRLARDAEMYALNVLEGQQANVPLRIRGRVRLLYHDGTVARTSELFSGIPVTLQLGFAVHTINDDTFTVFTKNIQNETKELVGYVQLLEPERMRFSDIPMRGLLYIIISAIISIVAFIFGLFFAKRSLKPAVEMMQHLEQFTADASHELKTPLMSISSSLDMAMIEKKNTVHIQSAKKEVEHMSTLINTMLDLTRLDAWHLQKESVHVESAVQEVVDMYTKIADTLNIQWSIDIVPGLQYVCDPVLFRQLLTNLLSNAIKFNTPNGTVTIVAKNTGFYIENSGHGIEKNDLPYIFDRLYQADAARSSAGSGLGLAFVKRIVDVHGWRCRVESVIDTKTVFSIEGIMPA